MSMDWRSELLKRIENRSLRLGVIGLGYVGLPLAAEFARAGFKVIGIDLDQSKVDAVNAGQSYIGDIDSDEVAELVNSGHLSATTDFSVLSGIDAVSICVPTPLRKTKEPNITYVVEAMKGVAAHAHPGMLVVLESTTYPGTTEELVVPALVDAGLAPGEDVFVAFSPERVDPGNINFHTRNTPKVIGGLTEACAEVAAALYECAVDRVIRVASPAAAEMVKLLENTFRAVNIALVNEFALMCDRLHLDVWDIIDAAATKPFGYMRFTPGPGLGGHCIPIDPLYLSWKLREMDYEARFIALADSINSDMPHYVISKVADALNGVGKSINGSSILLIGIAYKKNVSDMRESPALQILGLLHKRGAKLSYHDPYVEHVEVSKEFSLQGMPLTADAVREADLVLITTDHDDIDWTLIAEQAAIVVDTRNAMKGRAVAGTLVRL